MADYATLEVRRGAYIVSCRADIYSSGALKIAGSAIQLARWRAMTACRGEDFHLAVNGRKGRRVTCVLDLESERIETLDIAADEDETEDGDEDEDSDEEEDG